MYNLPYTIMVQTRIQLENLIKEELIDELISVKDIPSKLSDLTCCFDDFLRRYEILSSELSVTKNCNHLLSERVNQLERNVVNNRKNLHNEEAVHFREHMSQEPSVSL